MLLRAGLILVILTTTQVILLANNVPLYYFRQGIIVLLGLVLLVLIGLAINSIKTILIQKGKWVLFSVTSLLVQLLLITTAGLAGPYLILIHLTFFGIGFLFSFGVAMLFLVFTLLLVIAQLVIDPAILQQTIYNAEVLLLYSASFITVIPVAYILTQQYRLRELLSKTLTKQIKIEESILTGLDEMILVVDITGKILSLNDSVEQILHKSRSELLQSSFFSEFIIKDEKGTLLSDPSLFQQQAVKTLEGISLLTSFGMVKVNMAIKPIDSLEGEKGQVSIVLDLVNGKKPQQEGDTTLVQQAIARHDAMLSDLTKRLEKRGQGDLRDLSVMIAKSEEDIRTVSELQAATPKNVPIDLASLCRDIIMQAQDYARAFGVLLDFSVVNFGEADIKPLVTGNAPVTPDQLTGPFFTAHIDVKYLRILVQKIIEIAVLVVPKLNEKTIRLTVERSGPTDLLIKVTCDNHMIEAEKLPTLFTAYYGELSNRTELHFGTGLEGYIAKVISTKFAYPLQVNLTKDGARIVFLIWVTKGGQTLSAAASQQKIVSSIHPGI